MKTTNLVDKSLSFSSYKNVWGRFIGGNIFLIVILVAAFLIRVWGLSKIPPALSPDEASLGYNAYSILKTGKDEFGEKFPIIFKSFGDHKPGLYVYLTIPSVAIFGLNEFSVRFPSVVAGVLSVYLICLISSIFFPGSKKLSLLIGLSAAFSPWLIFFSRGAWEANVSLTLTLAGIYYFLKSLSRPGHIIFSTLFFSLTFITYQGSKLSTSIVILILLASYMKDIWKVITKNIKLVLLSLLVFLVIVAPVVASFFQGKTGRLVVFSVFSYPRPESYLQSFIGEAGVKKGSAEYFLYYSEQLNFVRGIMGRFFNHFSGKFLFFDGDYQNPRHSSPNHGMLLLTDVVFVITGLFFALTGRLKATKSISFILLWLVLSPLPAILSRDQVQSVRALAMAVPLSFLSGMGLFFITDWIRNRKSGALFYLFLFGVYLLGIVYFLDSYFVHYPSHNAKYVPYGYKDMVYKVNEIGENYKRIVIQQSYSQPYIYFLFYGVERYPDKYDPEKLQKDFEFIEGGVDVGKVRRLKNIEFVDFSWPYANGEPKTLIVGDDVVIPENIQKESYNIIWELKYPDMFKVALRMVETK